MAEPVPSWLTGDEALAAAAPSVPTQTLPPVSATAVRSTSNPPVPSKEYPPESVKSLVDAPQKRMASTAWFTVTSSGVSPRS